MARPSNSVKLAGIWSAIANHPGSCMSEIAAFLNAKRYEISRALPMLEEKNMLLFEEESKLYVSVGFTVSNNV